MIICNARSLAFALLIAALPVGFALAGGGGGRGGVVQLAPEWVRQTWGVPALAAGRRRVKWAVAPRRVSWAVDCRDRTTRLAMDRLERAIPV